MQNNILNLKFILQLQCNFVFISYMPTKINENNCINQLSGTLSRWIFMHAHIHTDKYPSVGQLTTLNPGHHLSFKHSFNRFPWQRIRIHQFTQSIEFIDMKSFGENPDNIEVVRKNFLFIWFSTFMLIIQQWHSPLHVWQFNLMPLQNILGQSISKYFLKTLKVSLSSLTSVNLS